MGGVTVLFCDDFHQFLPVIPRGTSADEVRACIKSSQLWHHITPMHMTGNMRVQIVGNENPVNGCIRRNKEKLFCAKTYVAQLLRCEDLYHMYMETHNIHIL